MKISVYVDFVLPFSRWFFLFPICRVAVRFWGSFNASVIFHFNFHSPCPSSTKISHILCHFSSKDLVMRQKLITILLALKSLRWALANVAITDKNSHPGVFSLNISIYSLISIKIIVLSEDCPFASTKFHFQLFEQLVVRALAFSAAVIQSTS